MTFTLPELPYGKDALEPYIDARTMEIHHGKHHAAYVANANAALEGTKFADETCPGVICSRLNDMPADKKTAIRNNAGGHYNHSLFWKVMSGGPGIPERSHPQAALEEALKQVFGSVEGFKEAFGKAAATRFGSGWAWLCVHQGGKVEVCSTANQDNPLMKDAIGDAAGCGGTPILGLDVWEHAYYLNYQNRRPDYISAFWNVVNWWEVSQRYEKGAG